jgi:hypothetical protein
VGLDREKQSHHHVVVSAVDGGRLSCDVDVYIELSDVNDNAPVFVDLPEKFGLLESVAENTLLLRITAEDPDLGRECSVSQYKLSIWIVCCVLTCTCVFDNSYIGRCFRVFSCVHY